VSTMQAPISLWAGDMVINGKQDGAINFSDIMNIAASFNTIKGNPMYVLDSDINVDGAINMTDIMIVAGHFNKTSKDY